MSKTRIANALFTLLLITSSIGVYGQGLDQLLENRHLVDLLSGNKAEVTVSITKDRIDIYSAEKMTALMKKGSIPSATEHGIPYQDMKFSHFNDTNVTYIVLRAWDKRGNCHLRALEYDGSTTKAMLADSCVGSPCSWCEWAPGCECRGTGPSGTPGFCNHVSQELEN